MAVDDFKSLGENLNMPGQRAHALTPDDGSDLSHITRGIYIGTSGDVTVTLAKDPDGQFVTLRNLAAGGIHGLRVKRVWATGTTATDIVGLY